MTTSEFGCTLSELRALMDLRGAEALAQVYTFKEILFKNIIKNFCQI